MACQPRRDGVTLRFYEEDPDGTNLRIAYEVFGPYANFRSIKRPIAPDSTDPVYGSFDWMSDVVVADSCERLRQIEVRTDGCENTSKCSCRVLVQWWVGDMTEPNRRVFAHTIAQGEHEPDSRVFRVHAVDVLPDHTIMGRGHPRFEEWKDGVDRMLRLQAEGAFRDVSGDCEDPCEEEPPQR